MKVKRVALYYRPRRTVHRWLVKWMLTGWLDLAAEQYTFVEGAESYRRRYGLGGILDLASVYSLVRQLRGHWLVRTSAR